MKHIYIAAFASVALFTAFDVSAAGLGCYMGESPSTCAARNRGETPLGVQRLRDGETGVMQRPKRINPEEGSGGYGPWEKKKRTNPEEGSGGYGPWGKKSPGNDESGGGRLPTDGDGNHKKGNGSEERHGRWR